MSDDFSRVICYVLGGGKGKDKQRKITFNKRGKVLKKSFYWRLAASVNLIILCRVDDTFVRPPHIDVGIGFAGSQGSDTNKPVQGT